MKKFLARLCAVGATAFAFALGSAHGATDSPAGVTAAAAGLKQDALCTRCNDEGETKPRLAIYQTRHGARADARTPTCQGCHGGSDKHLAGGKGDGNASRPAPDVVFKTRTTVTPPVMRSSRVIPAWLATRVASACTGTPASTKAATCRARHATRFM